jgi:hypothetical protein
MGEVEHIVELEDLFPRFATLFIKPILIITDGFMDITGKFRPFEYLDKILVVQLFNNIYPVIFVYLDCFRSGEKTDVFADGITAAELEQQMPFSVIFIDETVSGQGIKITYRPVRNVSKSH